MTRPRPGIYATPQWRQIRLLILERDARICQIRGVGCTGYATTVDHITPLAKGGAPYDPTNLRAACRWCNTSLRDGRDLAPIRNSRRW